MTQETIERASILMEIIAFFFVTVDLYGKERLAKLRESLKELDLITKLLDLFVYRYSRYFPGQPNSLIIFIFFIFGMISILSIAILILVEKMFVLFVVYTILISWMFISETIVGTIFIFILSIPAVVIFLILGFVSRLISTPLNFIAKFFKLEGVMIVIGAILFVTAKLMLYFSV